MYLVLGDLQARDTIAIAYGNVLKIAATVEGDKEEEYIGVAVSDNIR